jgi:D-serine deaminase-like pyridoxal phosphate-dependent protein
VKKVKEDIIKILYGLPVSPSSLPRLAQLSHALGGPWTLSLLIDHPDALDFICQSHALWPGPIPLFIKIDTGYHRSGTSSSSDIWTPLLEKIKRPETAGLFNVLGLYSHLGHSYGFSTPAEALAGLHQEFSDLEEASKEILEYLPSGTSLTLSVGATPTATAAQSLLTSDKSPEAEKLQEYITTIQKTKDLHLELHAGVYPVLDCQQIATHARSFNLSYEDIGLRMLTEVASLYPSRAKPEALIAAGSFVLGREPCKSYSGWGIVTPWRPSNTNKGEGDSPIYDEYDKTGWIVARISQEHGILSWEGPQTSMRQLKVGDKLLVWPNHACVAGSGFGWYLIVDSDSKDGDVIRDVWVRCRGW